MLKRNFVLFYLALFLLFLVILPPAAPAIVIRHDRGDARYVALGKKYESAYCRIDIPDGGGSLIAPEWILTAAHIAGEIKAFPHEVQCGSVSAKVEKVFINPDYQDSVGRNDIALLKLSEPITSIESVPIYTGSDEAMKTAILLGHFTTGNGKTGPDKTLKMTLRGATNRIEKSNDFWLYFNFDSPDSPAVTNLEGTPGTGDSGTPAYITVGGKLYVAGIGSRSVDSNKDGIEPNYGDTDLYARVSSYQKWIRETMARAESNVKISGGKQSTTSANGKTEIAKIKSGAVVSGELGAKLDEHLSRLADKGFSGAFLIAKNGQIILEKGYGSANRENKIPYTPATVFDIGSITKQFTGAAILKLEMQGKLKTSDKISKYFKDVPADKADITLHHLLTHSAGLIDALGNDYDKIPRGEMIKAALDSKLQTVPGETYSYSNLGYSLLGAIVEIVSKKSYERFLHDNLFAPAKMRQTGYSIPAWKRETIASGYQSDGKNWGTPLDKTWDKGEPFWNLRGNGGILSTVQDLYKWHLALEGEKILSKAAKEKYFAPYIKEQPAAKSFYGYGWVTQKTKRGTRLVSHDGGNGVFYALFRRYVDEDTVLIMASNAPLDPVGKEIAEVPQIIFETKEQPGRSQKFTPSVDYHQHLFSSAYVEYQASGLKTISAQDVINLLDKAGIRRAVLLSTAYAYGKPGAEPLDEYAKVKAENDWTAAQAALFPKRLIAFCGFNPLKDYALAELERCAKDPNLRYGIKLHFGNSDVRLENPEHLEKLKKIFQAANAQRMAIVVHLRASISKKRPYGDEQARAFLELLSAAPEVPVQVAHLASAGPGYNDPPAYAVIEVLADAVAKHDPRTRKLWFDVATVAVPGNLPESSALLVKLIRQIGIKRILYGSDAAAGSNFEPRESWEAFCQLNLTDKEIKIIAQNKAPYLR